MKKLALLPLIIASFVQMSYSQIPDLYLGLTPPGNTPEVFAPGIVSLPGRNERAITFSPSGHDIFFAIGDWPLRSTIYIKYQDSAWSNPDTASFSIGHSVDEPFFSMDGNRIYYYAYQPNSMTNADIYYSENDGDSWSAPISVGSTLNTTGDEFHPNIVNDGSIYFANSAGKTYRAQYSDGSFLPRVKLPNNVNSGIWPDHYVAPDESYMIFTSSMSGGFGSSDLYVSFRNFDKSWTTPQNFGNTINTSGYEGSGDVTPDGKYMTFDNIVDIYWVKIDNIIDSLKAISGVVTSVKIIPDNQRLNIFPNPGNGQFTLTFASSICKTGIAEISNSEGKVIFKRTVVNDEIIDLTGNPKGIYFLCLYIDKEVLNKKLIIQ
ncbi:MAG: T9SS type A sorting domain-containing protein [Bacteroidales bacterium]|nr:T9SS type A sorting domain-containing protein [Bacteroidales bacterium]